MLPLEIIPHPGGSIIDSVAGGRGTLHICSNVMVVLPLGMSRDGDGVVAAAELRLQS